HVLSAVPMMLQRADDVIVPPSDLEVALQTSRLRGVLAVRLFEEDGTFRLAIPFDVSQTPLSPADYKLLSQGQSVGHFHPKADLGELFQPELPLPERPPLQEVIIPLYGMDGGGIAGFAQYLIDGEPVQAEFAALDRTLLLQAGTAAGLGLSGLFLLA